MLRCFCVYGMSHIYMYIYTYIGERPCAKIKMTQIKKITYTLRRELGFPYLFFCQVSLLCAQKWQLWM